MLNYFKPKYVDSMELQDDGNTEINFIDNSRFIGQVIDQKIQKEGVFYIQDVAKFEGEFFENAFHEGRLSFKDICQLEGKFSAEEILTEGQIHFFKANKTIKLKNTFSHIEQLLITQNDETIELGKDQTVKKFEFEDGWVLELTNNYTVINLYKTINMEKFDLQRTLVDLINKTFLEENYHQGIKSDKTSFLSLGTIPYYQEFEEKSQANELPRYYTCSASGNIYEGALSFAKGTVTMAKKKYFFSGGMKEESKHGKGKIIFQDGCQKDVEYIEDKLAFEDLEEVFNFIANFDCLNHDELIKTNNINMVRFMKDVVSFKGCIEEGVTSEKCQIVFRNGDKFEGFIRGFKKQGPGEIVRGNKKIVGNFHNDLLPFGIIDYGNGTQYEGKLIDFERSGQGIMIFQEDNFFSGLFIGDQIHEEGGLLSFGGQEFNVFYVHIFEFDVGIFVEKKDKQLFVLDCKQNKVYDSKLIDTLKESGIDIRQSLRDMNKI